MTALLTRFPETVEEQLERATQSTLEHPPAIDTAFLLELQPPVEGNIAPGPLDVGERPILDKLLEEMRYTPSPPPENQQIDDFFYQGETKGGHMQLHSTSTTGNTTSTSTELHAPATNGGSAPKDQ